MKLSTLWEDADYEHIIDMLLEFHLSEDRNPELEKSLEPYLTGNFGAFRFRKPKDFKPSIAGLAGKLPQAVKYHADNMNGQRWPALEQAFMNRGETYKGFKSDFMRPRMSLCTYLKNLKEPWPEGVELVRQLVNSPIFNTRGQRYVSIFNPDIIECLLKYKIYSPSLVRAISNVVNANTPELQKAADDWTALRHEYEKKHGEWSQQRAMWLNDKAAELRQKAEKIAVNTAFHDEDEFGGDDYLYKAHELFQKDPTTKKLRESEPKPPPRTDIFPDHNTTWSERTGKLAQQYLVLFTNGQGHQQP